MLWKAVSPPLGNKMHLSVHMAHLEKYCCPAAAFATVPEEPVLFCSAPPTWCGCPLLPLTRVESPTTPLGEGSLLTLRSGDQGWAGR